MTSKDGTLIAFSQSGQGPAIILVDGALCYRGFGPMGALSDLLSPQFTVVTYERRGRGESGDTKPFAVEREAKDIEALIDHVGGPAFVYGISSGRDLAIEGSARVGSKIKRLAVYEPIYHTEPQARQAWKEYRKRLE